MATLTWKAVLMVLLFRATYSAFNCNRPGSKCVHGSCDYNNVCSCYRGYTGFLCDMETAKLAGSCPRNFKCKSGKCTKDARGKINGCHCDYDFYGPACDKPRYTMECYYDRMMMGLNPVGFRGHIRYIDKLTSSACDLKTLAQNKAAGVKDFDSVDWQGYGIVAVHKKDSCNGDAAYSTTHGFDIYTRKLVVQYYNRVYVSLDEIVTFICAVEKNNPVNVMKSVFTAPLEEGFLDKASVRGVGTHFVFSLHKSSDDGQIGDGDTLGVGALVFLKVKIREHSPFATLIIESCSADDGEGGNQTTYTFHDQGCPVAPVGQWIMKPNAKEFQLYFKIFRFEETNQLRITCVVRGCTSWDSPSCSISQCSHVDRRKREAKAHSAHDRRKLRQRRKRRQLRAARAAGDPKKASIILPDKEGGATKVNKLNSSEVIRLTVVITDKKKKGQQQQGVMVREVAAPNFQACTLSFEFWTVMISMTVVVVALTASTVSCALKRRKLKNRRKRKNEKTIKMALNNMKRMQMSSLPWSMYNR
ncbi:EGF-like domain-containing protein 2 [Babylonia areolata]|uniref:EGF-like domain-containing protein 2 n=1 Tax=Babylonia areolata TaxID=304850 RepID=UPI003FD529DD